MEPTRATVVQKYARVLKSSGLESDEQSQRIHAVQRDIVLPIKILLILTLFYYFYFSNWFKEASNTREVALDTIRRLFLVYAAFNFAIGVVVLYVKRLPLQVLLWTVFTIGLLDTSLFAALSLVTGGFDSILYWVFLGLIIHNAISIPVATLQIALNLMVTGSYVWAGLQDLAMRREELADAANAIFTPGTRRALDLGIPENPTEPFVLRIIILFLMTLCCYGVQALFEKQRRAYAEAEEFAVRRAQLKTAGRLAAEIAHRLKNPLGIINNAAFSLNRALKEGRNGGDVEQIDIIREEVDRADRILTELMGYARLAEGQVEKLDVKEVLEHAIQRVFPAGAKYEVQVHREYGERLPALLMQRGHLTEIFMNLLQNAREAMNGKGTVTVTTQTEADYSVVVTITDSGPGIPPEKIERVFEAYYSTKEKGTGLGLAIVHHNIELYGGTVKVQSELGKGARFIVRFPAKSLLKSNG